MPWRTEFALILAASCAFSATARGEAPRQSSVAAGDGRVSLPEDLPAGTRSLRVREVAHVLGAPLDRAPYIGKVTGGTRVAWQRVVAPDPEGPDAPKRRRHGEPCPAWVEIRPRGFLCRTLLVPSPEEPLGVHQPVVGQGRLAPDDYFKVMANDTNAYKSVEDVRGAVVDKVLSTKVMLVGEGVVHVEETPYVKTDHGLVQASALGKLWPPDFAGVNLREAHAPALPFAWIAVERGGRKPRVYPAPDHDAKAIREVARREIVPVLEERGGLVRIGDAEWIERQYLRVAAPSPVPASVHLPARPAEQWVDVDLDEQVLVLYEGATPVFATLTSTGGPRNPTPVASYRVQAKAATTAMAGDPRVPDRYEVSAVPWAVRFAKGLFVHGVYWHDSFGRARSHGCVNVSPRDAAFIYGWLEPQVPDGWSELEVHEGEGPIVRIRDHRTPDPPLFDYAREPQRLPAP